MGFIHRKLSDIYFRKALNNKDNSLLLNEKLNKMVEFINSPNDAHHAYHNLLSAITSSPEHLNLFVEKMNQIREKTGTNIIYDNVNLRNMGLTKLPDFSRFIVYGGFDCSYNKLSNLEGSPAGIDGAHAYYNANEEYITLGPQGGFDASNNNLQSLKGAPSFVRGYCDVRYNELTNLKYAPEQIRDTLYCQQNPISSLSGPQGVGNIEFDIQNIKDLDQEIKNGPHGHYRPKSAKSMNTYFKEQRDDGVDGWKIAIQHAKERLKNSNKNITQENALSTIKESKDRQNIH